MFKVENVVEKLAFRLAFARELRYSTYTLSSPLVGWETLVGHPAPVAKKASEINSKCMLIA